MSQIDRVLGCCEASGDSPVVYRDAALVAPLFAAACRYSDAALPKARAGGVSGCSGYVTDAGSAAALPDGQASAIPTARLSPPPISTMVTARMSAGQLTPSVMAMAPLDAYTSEPAGQFLSANVAEIVGEAATALLRRETGVEILHASFALTTTLILITGSLAANSGAISTACEKQRNC